MAKTHIKEKEFGYFLGLVYAVVMLFLTAGGILIRGVGGAYTVVGGVSLGIAIGLFWVPLLLVINSKLELVGVGKHV